MKARLQCVAAGAKGEIGRVGTIGHTAIPTQDVLIGNLARAGDPFFQGWRGYPPDDEIRSCCGTFAAIRFFTMRKFCAALAGLLGLTLPAAAAAASCVAEHARYAQVGRSDFTAALRPAGVESTAESDLLFVVQSKSHAYRFRFRQANGYGGISLEPMVNSAIKSGEDNGLPDLPDIRFIPYRADLTEIADAPRSGGRPPPRIVLPDLGARLWYDAAALGGPKERESMSRSAFVLIGCDRKAGKGKAGR